VLLPLVGLGRRGGEDGPLLAQGRLNESFDTQARQGARLQLELGFEFLKRNRGSRLANCGLGLCGIFRILGVM